MKRRLLVNVFAYGVGWLLLAGLNLLAIRFLGVTPNWWLFTVILVAGAFGNWFSGWLKSRQHHEKQLREEGAASSAPTISRP